MKNQLTGQMIRNFTSLYDIMDMSPVHNSDWNASVPDPASSSAPYRLLHVGNSNPDEQLDYVRALEKALRKKANFDMFPMQPGVTPNT